MITPFDALHVLERARPPSPASFARLVMGRAVPNARASLKAITASVADRLVMREQLDGPGEPGDLSRLSEQRCLELLATRSVGRLAYLARAGTPDIVPVNYAFRDGAVLISSGSGPKLQAAGRGDVVAFEVDSLDEETRTGWSVVLVGRAERLSPARASAMDAPEPWANGPRHSAFTIRPHRVSGRQLL